jgi:hypothetical protein
VHEVDRGHALEQLGDEMGRASFAERRKVELARLRSGELDKVLH